MSWDFSSEEAIVNKLESQQRTIEMFSKKIKSLEDENLQLKGQLNKAEEKLLIISENDDSVCLCCDEAR